MLIGGGGHALVIAEAAGMMGMHLPGYLDDAPVPSLGRGETGLTCLGGFADLGRIAQRCWILGVGNLELRRTLVEALFNLGEGESATTVIHPRACVSGSARIGKGVFIGPGAVVHSRAVIGDHAIVNSGAIVEHECTVGMNSHIAPGAILGGGVRVGAHVLVGMGSRVLPTLSIGSESTIGAGAVVLKSVAEESTAVGVPAVTRKRFEETAKR